MLELHLIFLSLIAGVLTILAPCVLPLMPILIGGSAGHKSRIKPIVITLSLMTSIIIFTLLLKASTTLIAIPPSVWTNISGVILIVFGLITVFPHQWELFSQKLGLSLASNKLLGKSAKHGGLMGDVLIGASLGPVFTSCSPTFALIIATVLPQNFAVGFVYLLLYALGLGIMLLLVAIAGQSLVSKLGWATNPEGWFKRIIGLLFILLGLAIITGLDKSFEAWLLDQGVYDPISDLELNLQGDE